MVFPAKKKNRNRNLRRRTFPSPISWFSWVWDRYLKLFRWWFHICLCFLPYLVNDPILLILIYSLPGEWSNFKIHIFEYGLKPILYRSTSGKCLTFWGLFGVGLFLPSKPPSQPSTIAARVFLWAANETCSTGVELGASKKAQEEWPLEILENNGLSLNDEFSRWYVFHFFLSFTPIFFGGDGRFPFLTHIFVQKKGWNHHLVLDVLNVENSVSQWPRVSRFT